MAAKMKFSSSGSLVFILHSMLNIFQVILTYLFGIHSLVKKKTAENVGDALRELSNDNLVIFPCYLFPMNFFESIDYLIFQLPLETKSSLDKSIQKLSTPHRRGEATWRAI